MKTVETTVVFLRRGDEILLPMKKRGFGAGRYNGAGGKIKSGESAKESAIRETREETGVKVLSLTQVADLTFHEEYQGTPEIVHSHVYICTEWNGEPTETDEMAPHWFNLPEIPYDNMWPDDIFWLPKVLDGEKVVGEFWFEGHDIVTDHKISTVDNFDETHIRRF